MCAPSVPSVATTKTDPVAAPTYADADVQKAGANTRQQKAATINRNIKSTALGVLEDASTSKKTLLGE
jgi:hypothetical protein